MLSITPWEKLIKQRWKNNKTKENVDIRGKKKKVKEYIIYYIIHIAKILSTNNLLLGYRLLLVSVWLRPPCNDVYGANQNTFVNKIRDNILNIQYH